MKVLAADTSTASGSVCLMDGARVKAEWTIHSEITHNRLLLKTIDRVLEAVGWSLEEVEGFAVTTGPGSFTGLRIGLTTLKSLAWALRKPFAGIPSLDALAAQFAFAAHPVCSLLDARKREVFVGLYQPDDKGNLVRKGDLRVAKPERILDWIAEPTVFCGDGWLAYEDFFREKLGPKALAAPAPHHVLRSSHVAHLARKRFLAGDVDNPMTSVPLYVRPSEAELHYPELSGHLSEDASTTQ